MVWQPTGSAGAPDLEVRVGTFRATMEQNPLLARPELGKIKKCLFKEPPPEKVFGYTAPKDPEGAREVTMLWKEHKSTLPATQLKPTADFKTLNKLAVDSGLTSAKELPNFRKEHMVTLKAPEEKPKKQPALPSSKNPAHTYGMASAHRSAEAVRTFGPSDPPVKYLVQGAYYDEWVGKNLEKEATTSRERPYIPPAPTRAAMGHSFGASRYLQPPAEQELWKMPKFKSVGPKVTAFTGGASKSASAPAPAAYPGAMEEAPAAAAE